MRMSRIVVAVSLMVSAAVIASCVNEDYDLNKPIDMTVGVNADISMPLIKNSKFITVKDLLGDTELGDNMVLIPFEEGEDPENPETDGYYMLKLEAENPISANFGILDFDIDFKNFASEKTYVRVDLTDKSINIPDIGNISLVGREPSELKGYYDLYGNQIELPEISANVSGTGLPIDINTELPGIIEAIDRIGLEGDIALNLSLDYGEIIVSKGFTVGFPPYISLEKTGDDPAWELIDDHTIRFVQNCKVKNTDLPLRITAIDVPDGAITGSAEKRLKIEDEVDIDGQIIADPLSFLDETSPVPGSMSLSMTVNMNEVNMGEALVKLNLDAALEEGGIGDQTIELGQILPEEIAKNEITLDIDNPVIILYVSNDSPLAASLNAGIDAFDADGNSVLGENNAIDLSGKVNVRANTAMDNLQKIAISRKGYEDNTILTEDNIMIPTLGNLIKDLPEKIVISGIGIKPDEEADGFTHIDLSGLEKGKELTFSCDYEVRAPIAFGEELDIRYAFERITDLNKNFSSVNGTGEDMKISLNKLQLDFKLANSLPIALGLEVTPIDLDGNPIEGKDLKVEIKFTDVIDEKKTFPEILSGKRNGNDTDPQETKITVLIEPESLQVLERLDGLDVVITGNSGDAAGIALSNMHGLQITDATVQIIGGVEMDPGNM